MRVITDISGTFVSVHNIINYFVLVPTIAYIKRK